jgi:serine/threonine protein kinase
MTNFTGQDIGRYRIIEPLGQGGMATVYRAYDTHLECEVAVKFIRMERLSREEEQKALKRFEREAKEIARLTHPNIVKVTDYGEYNGTPYLVMPYLPGGTLKNVAGKPMPYDQAARLLAPVARALEAAHQKNLIHRDIKPANILLTEGGQPMVSDFGIAKILGVKGGITLTNTNVAIGTPEYMAPEQWLNQISAQSDIYSLGVVFYELVTGRKPYTADTPTAIFLKQSNDPLPRPRSFVPDLPEEVERVLYKALAKKPEDRYASMDNFAAALEGLAELGKLAQPQAQVFETVTVRPEAPTVVPRPPEPEVFMTEETGQGIPASPSAVMGGTSSAESSSIPVSLPQKAASDRPSRGWVWAAVVAAVLVGLVGLVGVLALIGWAVSKKPSSLPATQTLQGLAVRQPTATTGLSMAPRPPTSTMTIGPTPLPWHLHQPRLRPWR